MNTGRDSALLRLRLEHVRTRIRLAIPGILIAAALLVLVGLATIWGARGSTLSFAVHTLHPDDQSLRQVRDLGAQYVVQVLSWSEIEPTPGEFHWEYTDWLLRAAEYYNLSVVARIDKPPPWASSSYSGLSAPPERQGDYAEFVSQVAARYQGRIAAYVIWNEPNLAREWGNHPPDAAAYVALLRAASGSIRAVDPAARILTAGLAPTNEHSDLALDDRDYLRAMYAAGASGAFDILAAHPYGFTNPPEDPRGAHDGLNFARLQDLHDIMVSNGDAKKPVWITEFGYTTSPPPGSGESGVTEEEQARFLVGAYELARRRWDWVQMFTVWNLSGESSAQANETPPQSAQEQSANGNPPQDNSLEQAGYSMLRLDGSFKPAYAALRTMLKVSTATAQIQAVLNAIAHHPESNEFPILARDSIVHLGDSEYPAPWVPLYQNRNPSREWEGEFYLRGAELQGARREQPWTLTMELMQVNDYDSVVLVNDQPTPPAYLPTEDFTSIWVTAQFRVPPSILREGRNVLTLHDGKLFPAFQQLGFTWDDFQVRNVILTPP
jgi:putative glycosyl hydrolase